MPVNVFTTIDDPAASTGTTLSFDINNLGRIVGQFADASGTHGFLLSGGTFTTIDDPLATGFQHQGVCHQRHGPDRRDLHEGQRPCLPPQRGRFHHHQ